jgi:hypothetical protein
VLGNGSPRLRLVLRNSLRVSRPAEAVADAVGALTADCTRALPGDDSLERPARRATRELTVRGNDALEPREYAP